MKITTVFLLTVALQASANGFGQKITLFMKNAPLEQVFKEIQKQSGYAFVYFNEDLTLTKKVDINVQSLGLTEVLERCIKDQPLTFTVTDKIVVIRKKPTEVTALAVEIAPLPVDVRGRVINEKNEPVEGVTIAVKGTARATATDVNGTFELKGIEEGATLMISNVNIESQEIKLNGKAELTINVKTVVRSLDEVVVTGTAMAVSKRKLGNAVTVLKSDDFSVSGSTSIDAALAGKVAGAQVMQNSGDAGAGISIRLRGVSTIFGNSDPLIMIDGVIINNESPTIIDQQGTAQNRLVDINPNDIERIEVVKGAAAAAIYGSRANNGVVQIFTKKGKKGRTTIQFQTGLRTNFLRKKIEVNRYPETWVEPNNNANKNKMPATRYDLQEDIFKPSVTTDNYLSLSGANDQTSYFLSGSYLKNKGILKASDFQRITLNARFTQNVTPWAKLEYGLNYINSKSNDIPSSRGFGAVSGFVFANNAINPAPSFGVYPKLSTLSNPLEVIDRFKFGQETNRFIGNVQGKFKVTPGIDFTIITGVDNYTQRGSGYIPVSNTSNTPNGYALTGTYTSLQFNNDVLINYSKKTNSFNYVTTAGGTYQYSRNSIFRIEADNLSLLSQSTEGGRITSRTDKRTERDITGYFLQQFVEYKDLVNITIAGRTDASSVFSKDNRWQFYPKVNTAILLSNFEFWKNGNLANAIPYLKIRAAYGQSGNVTGIGAYDRYTIYNPVNYNGLGGLAPATQLGNTTVKPERQIEKEIGIEAELFNRKLSVEVNLYHKKLKDLLVERSMAGSSGFASRFENIGEMTNKGWELSARYNVLNSKTFQWDVTGNVSYNKNKVDNIQSTRIVLAGGFDVAVVQNSYAAGAYYGTYYARDEKGNIVTDNNGMPQRAVDANGVIDKKIIGDPNPEYIYSLINEFRIHRLKIRFQFDGVQGMDVFNYNRRIMNQSNLYANGPQIEKELKGELPKGYGTAQFNIFEEFIEDGSYLKLRELSVSHPITFKNRKWPTLNLSLIGRNLVSIDNYSGWDPEINYAGQSNAVRNFDFTTIPVPASVELKIAVNF